MHIEDEVQCSFVSISEFMIELNRELLNPNAEGSISAVLRIRLDSHVPAVAFGGDVDGADMLRLSLDRLCQSFQACDLLANPKPGIILALLRNLRCEDDVERICDRILRIGERPFSFLGKTFLTGFSIGSAIIGRQQGTAYAFVRQITSDMHLPRDQGRSSFELFTPDFAVTHSVPSEIESYIRYAFREKLFGLNFQPQYTRGGALTGVGVLTQMRIPGPAWLKGEEFLPWLEDSQLAVKISRQTLRNSCIQAGDWHRRGVSISSFSVAIPTAHFLQKDFTQTVLHLLRDAGIPGSLLELGLTGSTIRANVDATGSILNELSARGVRFCICGSSIASLPTPYIRSLPIKTLEVSCSESALWSAGSVDVLRAVVAHGCRLGLVVRAVDVQSTSQRMALLGAGCDVLQGPLLSRSLSADEMEKASYYPVLAHKSRSIMRIALPKQNPIPDSLLEKTPI
jgi:EAL domain-containing protein (putative c-di-GMP-specific phosphodiesterase class I)